MYTIDASIHISALNPSESDSATSQVLLATLQEQGEPQISPTLLLVEVAAAVARALDDADRAAVLASAIRDLPGQNLVPLDEELTELALQLAATRRLRGADAVYGAVAQMYGTVLLTYDRQQLERLPPDVAVARPDVALRDLRK